MYLQCVVQIYKLLGIGADFSILSNVMDTHLLSKFTSWNLRTNDITLLWKEIDLHMNAFKCGWTLTVTFMKLID